MAKAVRTHQPRSRAFRSTNATFDLSSQRDNPICVTVHGPKMVEELWTITTWGGSYNSTLGKQDGGRGSVGPFLPWKLFDPSCTHLHQGGPTPLTLSRSSSLGCNPA